MFRRFYRIFRWVALAASVTVLLLILRQSRPPEVAIDPQAQTRAEAKVAEMEQAVAVGEPYTLQMEEAELNAWLQRNLALAGPGQPSQPGVEEVRSNMRDVRIKLEGDLLRAWVLFDFHGKELTLVLEGRLHVQGQTLRFTPIGGRLGSLPLPQATLDRAVARVFDDPANAESFRLAPDVADIRVEDGQLKVIRQ